MHGKIDEANKIMIFSDFVSIFIVIQTNYIAYKLSRIIKNRLEVGCVVEEKKKVILLTLKNIFDHTPESKLSTFHKENLTIYNYDFSTNHSNVRNAREPNATIWKRVSRPVELVIL